MQICDAVFEVSSTAGTNSTLWYEPDDIKITGPDGGFIELRQTAKAFIQSAEDYVIYECEYEVKFYSWHQHYDSVRTR